MSLGAAGVRGGLLAPGASAQPTREAEEVRAGELRLFAGDYVPKGWLGARGQELAVQEHEELAAAIRHAFGGQGDRVEPPDLRGRAVVGPGEVRDLPRYKVGDYGRALANRDTSERPSTLALTYLISPRRQSHRALIGEIRPFAFSVVPRDWAPCDGRLLSIAPSFFRLFSILGVSYGGDGVHNFALPDLRGRAALGHGDGPGLPPAPFASRGELLGATKNERPARLHLNYCIALDGQYPERS